MSAERPDPNEVPLEVLCRRFSAEPPNAKPVDALWEDYARDPSEAFQAFTTHIPEYGPQRTSPANSETGEIPGKVRVIAAFGGIMLASEANDHRALDAYKQIRPEIRRIGRRALETITQPIGQTWINGVGSALGIYLASNAGDIPRYTAWSDGARPDPFPRREPRTPGTENSKDHQLFAEFGLTRLQERYRRADLALLPLLVHGYAEVAQLTGAYNKFLRNPNDPISFVHIDKFVTACLRLARMRDSRDAAVVAKTRLVVTNTLNADLGDMFVAGARLLTELNTPGGRGRRVIPGQSLGGHDKSPKAPDDVRGKVMGMPEDAVKNKFDELIGGLTGKDAAPKEPTPEPDSEVVEDVLGITETVDSTDEDTSDLIPTTPYTSSEADDPSKFDPTLFMDRLPRNPNDGKWKNKFGHIYEYVNHRNSKAPALKRYSFKRYEDQRQDIIEIETPTGDKISMEQDDIIMVYPRGKNGRLVDMPSDVFQGIDYGLPPGFKVTKDLRQPDEKPQPPMPDNVVLPKSFGRKESFSPFLSRVSDVASGLRSMLGGQSHFKAEKLDIRARTLTGRSYVVYPTVGEPLIVVGPDGTLIPGGKYTIIQVMEDTDPSRGYRRVQFTTTLGALLKTEGYFAL